jgi:hypothetical protein
MIDNIVITHICIPGNHARITFDLDGVAQAANNLEYTDFFADAFLNNETMRDLKLLLNQHTHTSWATLKTELEA